LEPFFADAPFNFSTSSQVRRDDRQRQQRSAIEHTNAQYQSRAAKRREKKRVTSTPNDRDGRQTKTQDGVVSTRSLAPTVAQDYITPISPFSSTKKFDAAISRIVARIDGGVPPPATASVQYQLEFHAFLDLTMEEKEFAVRQTLLTDSKEAGTARAKERKRTLLLRWLTVNDARALWEFCSEFWNN
jgi:hypothetical protein